MRSHCCWIVGLLALLEAGPADASPNNPNQQILATQRWQVGAGPAKASVIFLHGLGDRPDSRLIQGLVKEFQRRGDCFSVTAPWLRPVALEKGEVVATGSHTMSDQLERTRAIIRETPGQVVLMGHSFGGKAALKLAQEFPDKVRCVVALAPSVNMLYSYWKNLTGERGLPQPAVIEARLAQHKTALDTKLAAARRNPKAARNIRDEISYLTVMKDLARYNETTLDSVRAPTLMLHGTNDEAVSIHYARRFADANPAVRLVEYEGLGHGFAVFNGLTIDKTATERATQDMAKKISDFIHEH